MTTDDALEFLRRHQPLPSTDEVNPAVLQQYDKVRRYFVQTPDEKCIPLLLNSFGEGDGHGIYPLVEDAILAHPATVVVPFLREAIANRLGSIRYWCAQIAMHFPDPTLIPGLTEMLTNGSVDERIAAISALETIGTLEAKRVLAEAVSGHNLPEVLAMLIDALRTK